MKRPFQERAFIVLWCFWGLWVSATFYFFGRYPAPNRSAEGLTIINIVFLHGELIAFLAGAPAVLITLIQYLVVGFFNPLRLFGEGLIALLWLLCWSWAGVITYGHVKTWEYEPFSKSFHSAVEKFWYSSPPPPRQSLLGSLYGLGQTQPAPGGAPPAAPAADPDQGEALFRQERSEARLEAFLVAFVPMVFLFFLQPQSRPNGNRAA